MIHLVCDICQQKFVNDQFVQTCSRKCLNQLKSRHVKVAHTACHTCKKPLVLTGPPRVRFVKSGRAYCSKECGGVYKGQVSGPLLAKYNRKHASARMRAANPMHVQKHKEAMRATLQRIGHKPCVRGGNGTGPTLPQKALADTLGIGWEMEFVVPTKNGERPYHYKLDIAHPVAKIAIEVDGASHMSISRHAADLRKDRFLEATGWRVFRFSNEKVLSQFQEIKALMSSILK